MIKITNEEEFNSLLHALIHIASILKNVENGILSEGQKLIIEGCEKRLVEIKQSLSEIIDTNNEE